MQLVTNSCGSLHFFCDRLCLINNEQLFEHDQKALWFILASQKTKKNPQFKLSESVPLIVFCERCKLFLNILAVFTYGILAIILLKLTCTIMFPNSVSNSPPWKNFKLSEKNLHLFWWQNIFEKSSKNSLLNIISFLNWSNVFWQKVFLMYSYYLLYSWETLLSYLISCIFSDFSWDYIF